MRSQCYPAITPLPTSRTLVLPQAEPPSHQQALPSPQSPRPLSHFLHNGPFWVPPMHRVMRCLSFCVWLISLPSLLPTPVEFCSRCSLFRKNVFSVQHMLLVRVSWPVPRTWAASTISYVKDAAVGTGRQALVGFPAFNSLKHLVTQVQFLRSRQGVCHGDCLFTFPVASPPLVPSCCF